MKKKPGQKQKAGKYEVPIITRNKSAGALVDHKLAIGGSGFAARAFAKWTRHVTTTTAAAAVTPSKSRIMVTVQRS